MTNIVYLDMQSGVVKTCEHTTFDEAWYCSTTRPPAPQILYDLGIAEVDDRAKKPTVTPEARHPPCPVSNRLLTLSTLAARMMMLPLRISAEPKSARSRMSKISKEKRWARVQDPYQGTAIDGSAERRAISNTGISKRDVCLVYFLRDPFHSEFEEKLNLCRYTAYRKKHGEMTLDNKDDRLTLKDVVPSSLAARIVAW